MKQRPEYHERKENENSHPSKGKKKPNKDETFLS